MARSQVLLSKRAGSAQHRRRLSFRDNSGCAPREHSSNRRRGTDSTRCAGTYPWIADGSGCPYRCRNGPSSSPTSNRIRVHIDTMRDETPLSVRLRLEISITSSMDYLCDWASGSAVGSPPHVLQLLTRIDCLTCPKLHSDLIPPLKSALVIPLEDGGKLVGVLACYSSMRDAFKDDHKYAIQHIGSALGELANLAASQTCIVQFRA